MAGDRELPIDPQRSVAARSAVEAMAALERVADGWLSQPFPPRLAEAHQVAGAMAAATQSATSTVRGLEIRFGAMVATSEEGNAIVEAVRQELSAAVASLEEAHANLMRVGVLSCDLESGLDEWSDRNYFTR